MLLATRLKRLLKGLIGPVFAGAVTFYFGWSLVHGDRGLIALDQARAEVADARLLRDAVAADKDALERRIRLMRDTIDPDLLDEQARRVLGYVREGDLVVLPGASPR